MEPDTRATLQAARDLLSDPAHWTQDAIALDETGREVAAIAPEAICWCLVGALHHCSGDDYERYNRARAQLYSLADGLLLGYNDTHTHAEVLALLDTALGETP